MNGQSRDEKRQEARAFEKNAIEAAIKIGILATMVIITVRIIAPFIMPLLWGIIIAVAVEPLIGMLTRRMGGRRKTVAALFSLVVIAALVIPSVFLVTSSIDTVQSLATRVEEQTLRVPQPPDRVRDWPLVGKTVYKAWNQAANNLQATMRQFAPQLKSAALTLLGKVGGGLKDVFMFIISVAIAGALLATADKGCRVSGRIATRFAGERGHEIVSLATATIRGVMQGVIGVALIQSGLGLVGMLVIGVPGAGLWAALVMLLAIIQLPPIIILGPVAAWVFSFTDTGPALVFLVYAVLVSVSDSFLKPILMGRGVDAPMLVILIGAIGGMMYAGIIGLFVGAVVVAIMYTLFMEWVAEEDCTIQEGAPDIPAVTKQS